MSYKYVLSARRFLFQNKGMEETLIVFVSSKAQKSVISALNRHLFNILPDTYNYRGEITWNSIFQQKKILR